jgi:DNA polymerase phi
LEALDDALGKLLKSHRLDKDKEAESSDDDADMSDSEMLELDNKLAEVFKHRLKNRTSKKKERKAAKESVLNFKRRVLDLLAIYIRNEPAKPETLAIMLPLLRLMRTSNVKTLVDRASTLIGDYQKSLKKARSNKKGTTKTQGMGVAQVPALLELLKEVHAEAAQGESHAHAKGAAIANLIVASTVFLAAEEKWPGLQKVFESLQPSAGGKKDDGSVQARMCKDWQMWLQNYNSSTRT